MGQFEGYSPKIHSIVRKSKVVAIERIKVQVHFVFNMKFFASIGHIRPSENVIFSCMLV